FGTGDTAGLMVRGTPAERRKAVGRAVELGINYFDTSPSYGKLVSETNLGRVLHEMGIRPVITTKVEVMPPDVDDIAGAVIRSIEGSLKRLRAEWIDVVEIHNSAAAKRDPGITWGWMPMSIADFTGPKGALEGLYRAQKAGKVRYLGICQELDGARHSQQLLETGSFSLINLPYNLVNPSAGRPGPPGLSLPTDLGALINHAQANGAGAAIFSPLARGVVTDNMVAGGPKHPSSRGVALPDNPQGYAPQQRQARALSFLSQPGRSLAQAGFRFVLMHPGVTTVLGGFSSLEHIEELAAVPDLPALTEQEMVRVEMVWRGNFGL
ncbi:MAG: aldo/keto reductase, partial [Chloroflexota bacterium]